MSTHTFARTRARICMLILLALGAALLPTRSASAGEQTVVLSPDQVRQAMWGANWDEHTPLKAIKLETAIRGAFAVKIGLSGTSNLNSIELIELQRRYLERLGPRGADPDYRNNLPYDEVTRAMFDAATTMPVFNAVAAQAWLDLLQIATENYTDYGPALDGLRAYSFDTAVLTYQGTVQQAALARAEHDPQFAKSFDETFGQLLGASVKDFDATAFIAEHTSLPQQLRDGIRPDGSVALSLTELEGFAKTEYGKVGTSIDDLQRSLLALDATQQVLVDFMQNEQARQQAQASAEAKAREHQLKLQAADSTISIIATLAGFIDPKVGHQIAVVGQSALQIGEALNGWMKAVAGLNTLDTITSLSTVVMTGNVLGAVVNIVSLFGDAQPTPEQMILEEIGKLREQVGELRSEMHGRFDRVDRELNTIYTTMQDRFDKIDIQLGKISGSLTEIQTTLATISLDLSRLERNNFAFLDALGRRPLRDAINGAIGYQRRTGAAMPYQPDFVGYENTFQTWGTINAFDALSAGPAERDYSDGQVLAELGAAPLDANLNYLNGWLGAHGLRPFASRRLPSPRDWAFASRAYANIGFDWPAHLRRIDPQRQAALDAVGGDLEAALQNISTIQTANGPQGNAPLFTGVITYYSAKMEALDTAIQSTEAGFVHEVWADRLHREAPFDLFGGLDQALAYQTPEIGAMGCAGIDPRAFAAPSNIHNIIPSYNRATLADYLHVSTLTVCLTDDWVDRFKVCQPKTTICDTFATPEAIITVYSNNVAIATRAVAAGEENIAEVTLREVINRDWTSTYKPLFEAQFDTHPESVALAPTAAAQLAATASDLENTLVGYQRELYGRVLNGLGSGGLHPAAVELAGATKLLDSFVAMGLPQAVDGDDFLRSLLFSDQQLLDDQQVLAAYAARLAPTQAASAAGDALLTTNPRLTLREVGRKRREALRSLITRYLEGIGAGTYREDSTMIADARLALKLTRSFGAAGAEQPPTPTPTPDPTQPGQSKHVFLPLVVR